MSVGRGSWVVGSKSWVVGSKSWVVGSKSWVVGPSPSVKVCYGCGGELKPGGRIPDPPNDLVIVSGDKRSYYDTQTKKIQAK